MVSKITLKAVHETNAITVAVNEWCPAESLIYFYGAFLVISIYAFIGACFACVVCIDHVCGMVS